MKALIITLLISVTFANGKQITLDDAIEISNFCKIYLTEDPECKNSIIGCYMDDIYTIHQCEEEYVTGVMPE